jgi:hypothetical protein
MAKVKVTVGYGSSVNLGAGVWDNSITNREYTGTVVSETSSLSDDESVVGTSTVSNSISILADEYAIKHFQEIKFIKWDGAYYTVTSVSVRRPRLTLNLGGVYNGPKS